MEDKLVSDELNSITGSIVDAAINVHRELGPGLLESAYETCLAHELTEREFTVQRQIALPIRYKNLLLDDGYRIDLLVSKKVVVELKVVDMIKAVHKAQLLSYLKLSNCPVGLLINFNEYQLKRGIKRFVN